MAEENTFILAASPSTPSPNHQSLSFPTNCARRATPCGPAEHSLAAAAVKDKPGLLSQVFVCWFYLSNSSTLRTPFPSDPCSRFLLTVRQFALDGKSPFSVLVQRYYDIQVCDPKLIFQTGVEVSRKRYGMMCFPFFSC